MKKFNPLWVPFLTFWIPSVIASSNIGNENVKLVLIWAVILIQVYFLYHGINYLKLQRQAGGNHARTKKKKNSV